MSKQTEKLFRRYIEKVECDRFCDELQVPEDALIRLIGCIPYNPYKCYYSDLTTYNKERKNYVDLDRSHNQPTLDDMDIEEIPYNLLMIIHL